MNELSNLQRRCIAKQEMADRFRREADALDAQSRDETDNKNHQKARHLRLEAREIEKRLPCS